MKPKSINSLMAYMRNIKGIKIKGSNQKRKLRYMGYFHGYKGYRYCNSPNSKLNFTDFSELQAVYDFDMKVKSILYPQIMFLETALKNYALEIILEEIKSKWFADIYFKAMDDYKSYPVKSSQYKKAISRKMDMRNKIYSAISREYGKRLVVNHYYDKDQQLPIWAIFELLSLGEFGMFISCLNPRLRSKISRSIGIKKAVDSDGKLLGLIVYVLKDLRNAVAHNNTVFDTRFKSGKISHRISAYITAETGVENITFDTIVDYILLICFLMKLLECNKSDILTFIHKFETICENFKKRVPMNIYSMIIYTDTKNKIIKIKKFL